MTENERAVIEAARRWSARVVDAGLVAALLEAVHNLESDTCTVSAVGGDYSWPYTLRCVNIAGHAGRHKDPLRGEWILRS